MASRQISLFDCLERHVPRMINCPACGLEVKLSSINKHLDDFCVTSGDSASASLDCVCGDESLTQVDSTMSNIIKQSDTARYHVNGIVDCPQPKENHSRRILSRKKRKLAVKSNIEENLVSTKKQIVDTEKPKNMIVHSVSQNVDNIVKYESDKNLQNAVTFKTIDCVNPEKNSEKTAEISTSSEICDSALLEKLDSVVESSVHDSDCRDENDNSTNQTVPYYLENFLLVLRSVLEDEHDRLLVDESDMSWINKFYGLSIKAQQLFVRLFQRKYRWIQVSKICYPRIADDLQPAISELIKNQFLLSEKDLCDVTVALKLLGSVELRNLAKDLHISATGLQMSSLTKLILEQCTKQRNVFGSCRQHFVLKKAKKLLDKLCIVAEEPRVTLLRVLMLFNLTSITLDDTDPQAQPGLQQLFSMLLVNLGKIQYPKYVVEKKARIFQDRASLLRFQNILTRASDLLGLIDKHKFSEALNVFQEAKAEFNEFYTDKNILQYDLSLPPWVRCFTACSLYTKVLYLGVETLQKLRDYGTAVDVLRNLLSQSIYCCEARGRWWDRLALNLDQHLKQPDRALEAIIDGLSDKHVRTGHRLALRLRAEKICKSPRNVSLHKFLISVPQMPCSEPPERIFLGKVMSSGVPGKTVFVTSDCDEDGGNEGMVACGVENLCIIQYKQQLGYTDGVHGEGSAFTTILGLLFWDILFMPGIPDAFRGPYQSGPLDLRYDCFYENRKEAVDTRLCEIANSDEDFLTNTIASCWEKHADEECSLISWDLYESPERLNSLIACIGGETLAKILERIIKDHKHCRGGMPDLVVWNNEKKMFKVSEVKGPGDRLSHKQMLWLDFFCQIGVDAEVCYVRAVGSKQLPGASKNSVKVLEHS